MSDSLRDALEGLVEEWRWKGDLKPWQEGGGPDAYSGGLDDAAAKLRSVLAAHPVEPECLGDGVCTNPRCPRHGIEWECAK